MGSSPAQQLPCCVLFKQAMPAKVHSTDSAFSRGKGKALQVSTNGVIPQHCSALEQHPFHGKTKPNERNLFLNKSHPKTGLNVKVLKVLRFQVTMFPFPMSKVPWENTEFYCNFHISIHDQKSKKEKEKGFISLLPLDCPILQAPFLPTAVYFLGAFLMRRKKNCRRAVS